MAILLVGLLLLALLSVLLFPVVGIAMLPVVALGILALLGWVFVVAKRGPRALPERTTSPSEPPLGQRRDVVEE